MDYWSLFTNTCQSLTTPDESTPHALVLVLLRQGFPLQRFIQAYNPEDFGWCGYNAVAYCVLGYAGLAERLGWHVRHLLLACLQDHHDRWITFWARRPPYTTRGREPTLVVYYRHAVDRLCLFPPTIPLSIRMGKPPKPQFPSPRHPSLSSASPAILLYLQDVHMTCYRLGHPMLDVLHDQHQMAFEQVFSDLAPANIGSAFWDALLHQLAQHCTDFPAILTPLLSLQPELEQYFPRQEPTTPLPHMPPPMPSPPMPSMPSSPMPTPMPPPPPYLLRLQRLKQELDATPPPLPSPEDLLLNIYTCQQLWQLYNHSRSRLEKYKISHRLYRWVGSTPRQTFLTTTFPHQPTTQNQVLHAIRLGHKLGLFLQHYHDTRIFAGLQIPLNVFTVQQIHTVFPPLE
ncbi:hypothetical protein BDF21DRAFT_475613 [Thamnidium elegans]|nr:hypothetical protein BDF21DRAFT_475613 [Thamnidium elegans]